MVAPADYKPDKIFTVEEANARLPLVRAIVADIMKLSSDLFDRRERLNQLQSRRPEGTVNVYQEELAQIEEELERDVERLNAYVEELLELGVEPKGVRDGLVDFPAILDDKLVYLCWKFDEPEVLHWHDLDAGFEGRQSLTAGSVAEGADSEDAFDV
ncbi:MAG: hypothetical protein CMJ64_08380 [Planctomycetaceae bacterium]|nr:hypothetical protein [Planctomycetaceae bacterium]